MFPFKKKKKEVNPFDFPSPPQAAPKPSTWLIRLQGLAIVSACLLLGLCLYSYVPAEMHWDWLKPENSSSAISEDSTNLLGIIGTYSAALLYYLFGAGAWWLLALLTFIGLRRLMAPLKPWSKQWICLLLLLIFACMSLSLQHLLLVGWAAYMGINSAGGLLGSLLGPWTLAQWMQAYIPFCLAVLAHAIALVYFVDSTPQACLKVIWNDIKQVWHRWREHRRNKKMWSQAAHADESPLGEQGQLDASDTESPFYYKEPRQAPLSTEQQANAPIIKSRGAPTHETPAQLVQQQMEQVQEDEPRQPLMQPAPNARSPRPKAAPTPASPKAKQAIAAPSPTSSRPLTTDSD
ncbi:MAG: DNA translocase FtsK 4TM domain-containing protein, partial [Akkermansia sp.]